MRVPACLNPCQQEGSWIFVIPADLIAEKFYPTVALTCISLIIREAGHLLIDLLTLQIAIFFWKLAWSSLLLASLLASSFKKKKMIFGVLLWPRGLRIWCVTAAAWVTVVVWGRSLAWKPPHIMNVAKTNKQTNKKTEDKIMAFRQTKDEVIQCQHTCPTKYGKGCFSSKRHVILNKNEDPHKKVNSSRNDQNGNKHEQLFPHIFNYSKG